MTEFLFAIAMCLLAGAASAFFLRGLLQSRALPTQWLKHLAASEQAMERLDRIAHRWSAAVSAALALVIIPAVTLWQRQEVLSSAKLAGWLLLAFTAGALVARGTDALAGVFASRAPLPRAGAQRGDEDEGFSGIAGAANGIALGGTAIVLATVALLPLLAFSVHGGWSDHSSRGRSLASLAFTLPLVVALGYAAYSGCLVAQRKLRMRRLYRTNQGELDELKWAQLRQTLGQVEEVQRTAHRAFATLLILVVGTTFYGQQLELRNSARLQNPLGVALFGLLVSAIALGGQLVGALVSQRGSDELPHRALFRCRLTGGLLGLAGSVGVSLWIFGPFWKPIALGIVLGGMWMLLGSEGVVTAIRGRTRGIQSQALGVLPVATLAALFAGLAPLADQYSGLAQSDGFLTQLGLLTGAVLLPGALRDRVAAALLPAQVETPSPSLPEGWAASRAHLAGHLARVELLSLPLLAALLGAKGLSSPVIGLSPAGWLWSLACLAALVAAAPEHAHDSPAEPLLRGDFLQSVAHHVDGLGKTTARMLAPVAAVLMGGAACVVFLRCVGQWRQWPLVPSAGLLAFGQASLLAAGLAVIFEGEAEEIALWKKNPVDVAAQRAKSQGQTGASKLTQADPPEPSRIKSRGPGALSRIALMLAAPLKVLFLLAQLLLQPVWGR